MRPQLTSSEKLKILEYLQQNKKIEAIKLIRDLTGISLAQAKDFVDTMQVTNVSESSKTTEITIEETVPETEIEPDVYKKHVTLTREDVVYIRDLISNGKKIEAIKFTKEKLDCTLAEAKSKVDYLDVKAPQMNKNISQQKNQSIDFSDKKNLSKSSSNKKSIYKAEDNHNPEKSTIPKKKSKYVKSNSGCLLILAIIMIPVVYAFINLIS